MVGLLPSGFQWVTGSNPGFQPTQDGCGFINSVLKHNERRTGARVFSQSGTVGDIPPGRIKLTKTRFDIIHG
jgi:hypothetical protein